MVALGPWSDDIFRPLGYDIPLAVKRGYHMHYGVRGNATLGRPVRDADGGFSLGSSIAAKQEEANGFHRFRRRTEVMMPAVRNASGSELCWPLKGCAGAIDRQRAA